MPSTGFGWAALLGRAAFGLVATRRAALLFSFVLLLSLRAILAAVFFALAMAPPFDEAMSLWSPPVDGNDTADPPIRNNPRRSFYHLVGASEERRRYREPERFGSFGAI
jgi:hypothetical protein